MKRFCAVLALVVAVVSCASISYASASAAVPANGMVTVIDLGAKTCIPCKMMVPVLEAMEKQFQGKASIVFIDVRENPDQVAKFAIRAIPTQIFFDKTGKEVYRHEGFLDAKPFADVLDKILEN